MRAVFLILAATVFTVSACAPFPEGTGRADSGALQAPYPTLVPLASLDARISGPMIDRTKGLEARANALRRRAAALRGRPVLEGAERLRLLAATDR